MASDTKSFADRAAGLTALHDPFDKHFRSPFGAVPCGGSVTLRLFVRGESARASLRVWDGAERVLPPEEVSEEGGGRLFTFRLTVSERPCVLWYSFRLETGAGVLFVGAEDAALRCGCRCSEELPSDFRITVYYPAFSTPEWFRGCTVYQIFPDRFRRGEYKGLARALAYHREMGRAIVEKQWGEPLEYLPHCGKKYYSPDDFYCGNFRGIIDAIPYLKSLGIDAVYLNPIFESPYNHRYSISDYMRPDPLLGSERDFADMCSALAAEGIRVILDGVFSHTGDDSLYFDRYSRYGGGAFANTDSPYRSWYFFDRRYKCGYRSWWGFDTLPEVDELDPAYQSFIGSVLEKWIGLGASGWRLDVADELPNGFIKFIRKKLKSIAPEAPLIGEVWEDASLKEGDSDGDGGFSRRGYTDGDMLDGVMDYPFAEAVCAFLTGGGDSHALFRALCSQLAGYPAPFMRAQLGLLGSHDTYRVLSLLSGAPPVNSLPREEQAVWRPSAAGLARGRARLMQASALQFSMPFAPCVYYGDEAGLQGLTDPFCRRPFPWGDIDGELLAHYRGVASLRREYPALRKGETAFAAPNGEAFAVLRRLKTAEGASVFITVVSRSAQTLRLSAEDFFGEYVPAPGSLGSLSAFTLKGGVRTPLPLARTQSGLTLDLPGDGFAFIAGTAEEKGK